MTTTVSEEPTVESSQVRAMVGIDSTAMNKSAGAVAAVVDHVAVKPADGSAVSIEENFNQVVISQGSVLPAYTDVQENRRYLRAVSGLKMLRSLLS
jgi:hypothetical protein